MAASGTYTPEELAGAKRAGRKTPSGIYYVVSVAGKKTAGIKLLKEPHHTSDDVTKAKRHLTAKWPVTAEIGTYLPQRGQASGADPA